MHQVTTSLDEQLGLSPSVVIDQHLLSTGHLIMGLRSRLKRKVLGLVFDSITDSFDKYVERNPGCRLCEASAAVLPADLGKRSRLFASHVMDDLVLSGRVIKHKGPKFPRFYHSTFLD